MHEQKLLRKNILPHVVSKFHLFKNTIANAYGFENLRNVKAIAFQVEVEENCARKC
jgi:hypothetical protein